MNSVDLFRLTAGEGVQGARCVIIRVGENECQTKEGHDSEWDVDHELVIGNVWKDKIEIETWQEQEKELKENFTRVWLRSLDHLSKKFRSTLRSQNLAGLSSTVLGEGSNNNNNRTPSGSKLKEPNTPELRSLSAKTGFNNSDSNRGVTEAKGDKEKRGQTMYASESSNWVLNAFATLRRPTNRKTTPPDGKGVESSRGRFLDIKSPIPTSRESLRETYRSLRTKSETSFFSKYDAAQGKGKFGGREGSGGQENGGGQEDKSAGQKEPEKGDIKAKSEVNVRRQLFRNDLDSSSVIPEGGVTADVNPVSGVIPISDRKPISVVNPLSELNSMSDFSTVSLTDDSPDDPIRYQMDDDTKQDPPKSKLNSSSKYGSLKLSSRNEFQLWKRMSLSLRDKSCSPAQDEMEVFRFEQKEEDVSKPPQKGNNNNNNNNVTTLREEETEASRIKIKTSSSSIKLKDSFLKMNCSKWTVEEEAILVPSTPRKESNPARPPRVALTLQLQCQPLPVPIPPCKVFFICLKQLLSVEKNLEVKEHEDFGLCLPLSPKSKVILKSLAFVYNIPEAQISLACWLVLTQGHDLTASSGVKSSNDSATPVDTTGHKLSKDVIGRGRSDEIVVEYQPKKLRRLFGVYRNIHPKFLFHWLTKIEAAASCSSYTDDEERQIGSSILNFINNLCQQFERIHASFPVNQSSHLALNLRCVHLLAESKSIQSIMERADLEVRNLWPKSNILNAVQIHAKNWTEALVSEIRNGKRECPLISSVSQTDGNHGVLPAIPSTVASSSFLLQAIMNGEKAMLAINDFIVLGEKVYDANFKSELDESYLQIVWPTITSVLVTLLGPIQTILHSSGPKTVLSDGLESLQDLHISLWILLLQLSKLQRFQNTREKESNSKLLPETFSETFFLLSRLWLNICLLRAKEMTELECRTDDLNPSDNDDGLSSSARELTDLFNVIQEKLSRFSFPPDKIFKENLALFLEEGIESVVQTYQFQICNIALEKGSQNNILTRQMCLAVNNVDRVTVEADNLISSLSPLRERKVKHILPLRTPTEDACFFLFTKSLHRLPVWITNALSSREKEMNSDYLMDWVKSVLDPILDYSPNSMILLRHFWDFVFNIVKEKLKSLSQPQDFRTLGNFIEKLYYLYKISLRIDLYSQSQIEFQNFMEIVQLKGSSTTEVIQMYFAERYKEQESLTSSIQPLVVNAYFCKDKTLKVGVYMSPYVDVTMDRRLSLKNTNEESSGNNHLSQRKTTRSLFKGFRVATQMKRTASDVIGSLTKSSAVNFYVKGHPVPSNWFKKVREKKTKSTQRNPPVFEDQLSFNIKNTDEGVVKGGFLLLRLKYSSMTSSGVESEALLSLQDIPLLSSEERKGHKHSFLKLSAPSSSQDYKALVELTSRKQDKEASSFLVHLHQSYWVGQSP